MRRAYYTRNTSDYRTVSKKAHSFQKEKKLKILSYYTRPPERVLYIKMPFSRFIEGPYLLKMTFF